MTTSNSVKEDKPEVTLTNRERVFLALVAETIDSLGVQPSYREAAAEMGYSSVNSIASIVRQLQRKKLVTPTARGLIFDWRAYL